MDVLSVHLTNNFEQARSYAQSPSLTVSYLSKIYLRKTKFRGTLLWPLDPVSSINDIDVGSTVYQEFDEANTR